MTLIDTKRLAILENISERQARRLLEVGRKGVPLQSYTRGNKRWTTKEDYEKWKAILAELERLEKQEQATPKPPEPQPTATPEPEPQPLQWAASGEGPLSNQPVRGCSNWVDPAVIEARRKQRCLELIALGARDIHVE